MSNPDQNLGAQLPALEQASPDVRGRYERRLQEILEERLSLAARAGCQILGSVCLLFALAAAVVVFGDREAYGYWPNLLLGAIVTASAGAIGIALLAVAIRGLYRRQREGRWAAAAWTGRALPIPRQRPRPSVTARVPGHWGAE
jgi:hypothetical protein